MCICNRMRFNGMHMSVLILSEILWIFKGIDLIYVFEYDSMDISMLYSS